MIDIFILAGEPSGDLHGAHLIEELLALNPNLKIAAVAGPLMRKFPIECIEPMENLQVIGFIDVILALPSIIKRFFSLKKKIRKLKPKAFVTIDYPGFNLRLQTSLKKSGFKGKQIHYICPTVWAWGKGRIPKMAKSLDLLLTLFPFEPECFRHTQLETIYVGHPLIQDIATFQLDTQFRARFGFSLEDKIISIFPGSRELEVKRNLPGMIKTAKRLQEKDPKIKIAICSNHPSFKGDIPPEENYNLMKNSHIALAKSGTVVLELALLSVPTVVSYAIKPLDVFVATKIFKINLPYYSMPNIILQKEVFPELFGPQWTDSAHYQKAENLVYNEEARGACKVGCAEIWSLFGAKNASKTAAEKINYFLQPDVKPKTL
jgi:lipid-A-disaccharide synthase